MCRVDDVHVEVFEKTRAEKGMRRDSFFRHRIGQTAAEKAFLLCHVRIAICYLAQPRKLMAEFLSMCRRVVIAMFLVYIGR